MFLKLIVKLTLDFLKLWMSQEKEILGVRGIKKVGNY